MRSTLFVDESYGADHYYVSGVLVDDQSLKDLTARLDAFSEAVASRHGLAKPPEFHAHAIMNAGEDWKFLHNDVGTRVAILRRLITEIAAASPEIVIEGVDVARLHARYRYPDSPYEISLRHMLERVNDRCRRYGADCQVFADMIDRSEDFVEAIDGYTRTGTPGYRSSRLARIEQPITYIDSRESRGLQAADAAVYITRRVRENVDGSQRSRRASARMKKILDDCIWHERKWTP